MATDPAVGAWARALFEIAQAEAAVEKVGADLKAAAETIRGHLKLKSALSDPDVPGPAKAAVVHDVLGADVSPVVANAIVTLAQTGKQDLLGRIVEAYETVSEEVRGVAIADVTTAVELTDGLRDKLRKQLAGVAGKEVVLREHVDPQILGGVVVRVGGKIMDGSVASRLAKLKGQMVAARSDA
jgi:F-type H+-transporting ATPase subunit delta